MRASGYDVTVRYLVVLAAIVTLCGLLPTALEPVAAADPAGRQVPDIGPTPAPSDDSTSTSADPPAPSGRAWQATHAGGAPAAGGALRASAITHPAHPRLVWSGSSGDPDPRSHQHISPLTVSLRI